MRCHFIRCKRCTQFLLYNDYFVTKVNSETTPKHIRKCSSYSGNKYIENGHSRTDSRKLTPFSPVYDAAKVEAGVYDWWEGEGFFKPNATANDSEPFSLVLPPPNVTGTLHLGHALTITVQDVLARWHRMQGRSVSWVPGMDHAGIATQVAVEKKLWQEKRLTRHDIGREEFEKVVWKWKNEKAGLITQQLRRLGASLDWSREIFTMDPKQSSAVTEAFIRLYDDNLIYRANSLVNWSCVLQSAISDIEVVYKEIKGPTMMSIPGYTEPVEFGVLTNFAYKLHNSDEEIVVSTTRVETIPGDVAVAVHPLDERYKKWHGAQVWHPFRQETIPVICDKFVEPTFGTGAVKITPAHSYVDYEVGKQHNLKVIPVVSEDGTLNENCGNYSGMRRFEARKCIADDLKKLRLLREKNEHAMTVPICSRSGDAVEFLLKSQWFINCQEMGKQAATVVRNGDLKIDPTTFEKTWFSWLDNIRDWCVSRQLWWGHRVPMYECHNKLSADSSVWVAAKSVEEARNKAAYLLGLSNQEAELVEARQDTDVLDTWFSSALFPFSALGWPAQSGDLARFYPLSLMETGHDILFFWVARMVMLGTYCTGKLPFKKVLLHGIICDAMGKKMSKSLGNVIDPEDVVNGISLEELATKTHQSFEAGLLSKAELKKALASQKKLFPAGIPECGTDALRFTLCSQNITNFYINFDVNKCFKNSAFCNKIWQACKYVKHCFENIPSSQIVSRGDLSKMDRWILSRLAFMVAEVDRALHNAEFHTATAAIKTFLYNEFCDIYLETTKPVVRSGTPEAGAACWTLLQCILTAIRTLSPFMPFITEELYQRCMQLMEEGLTCEKSIMVAAYPKPEEWAEYRDEGLENEIIIVNAIILAIRRLKSMYNINRPEVHIVNNVSEECKVYSEYVKIISTLARCGDIVVTSDLSKDLVKASITQSIGLNCSVYIIVKGKDTKEEYKKILKRCNAITEDLAKLMSITTQPGYKARASPDVQDTHFKKIQTLEAELNILKEYQNSLKSFR